MKNKSPFPIFLFMGLLGLPAFCVYSFISAQNQDDLWIAGLFLLFFSFAMGLIIAMGERSYDAPQNTRAIKPIEPSEKNWFERVNEERSKDWHV